MTRTPDVVPDEIIEPVWGNEIRDRTRQRFATAAERDAEYADATDGATAYTAADGGMWWRHAGLWFPEHGQAAILTWQGKMKDRVDNPQWSTAYSVRPEIGAMSAGRDGVTVKQHCFMTVHLHLWLSAPVEPTRFWIDLHFEPGGAKVWDRCELEDPEAGASFTLTYFHPVTPGQRITGRWGRWWSKHEFDGTAQLTAIVMH